MNLQTIFIDVVETPWLEEHRKSIIFFAIVAFLAIGTLIGIFVYRRKHKK
jgi:hypothetical protein